MSLRLEKQLVSVETVVGENTAQSVVEGSVSVPGGKPEIGRALRVKAVPNLTGYDVTEGRVSFEGTLDFELLYASFTEVESEDSGEGEPELVLEERLEGCEFTRAVPFAFVLDVPGAAPGMQASTAVTVESVSFEVQSDQRTVDVDVVLEFSAQVKTVSEQSLAVRAVTAKDVEAEYKEVRLRSAATHGRGQTAIECFLPFGGRALPGEVLEINLTPAAPPAVKLVNDVAEISGSLNCSLLYTADEVGAALAEWNNVVQFAASAPLPGVAAQAKTDVSLQFADVHWRKVDSDDARGVEVTAGLLADVQALAANQVSVITGIAGEGPITIATRTEPLTLQEAVGEGVITVSADATLELTAGAAPIERVLVSEAKAKVEDVHVLGDKVAIEGAASLSLVYVGRSGDTTSLSTTAWPAGIPFDFEVPLPGAEPGLERKVELKVDKVTVDLINRETVDVSIQMTAKVALSRTVELEAVVEAVEVPPLDANPPTFTFVVLQEGDTLWALAQKYHSDVASLLQANRWLESESAELPVGAKLCIPRPRHVA